LSEGNLLNIFIEEAKEILEKLEIDLLKLENEPTNQELINKIFRAMHTLKGSAGLAGLSNIADFVHHGEDLLDQIRDGLLDINPEIINLLLETRDITENMVQAVANPDYEIDEEGKREVSKSLRYFIIEDDSSQEKEKIKKEEKGEKVYKIGIQFNSELFQTGTDPLLLVDELSELGEIMETNFNITKIPEIYELNPEECYLSLTILFKTEATLEEIEDVFIFIEFDSKVEIENVTKNFAEDINISLADKKTGEILVEKGILTEEDVKEALSRQKKLGEILTEEGKVGEKQIEKVVNEQKQSREIQKKSTIKVETDKLEVLMNSMAELVISQAKVKELALNDEVDKSEMELITSLDEVDKRIRNLQEEIMNARMVPIGNTFLRFRRLVRDLSKEQGKEIELEIKGKETELDKKIIEKIGDPLKHLIRNSIDHGIETPEVREEKGKSRKGKITLNAYHQEGNIIIEITDDGQGLDKDNILEEAKQKELIESNQQLDDEEIWQLICEPGLSTNEEVTETSGRGVGMDVVSSNLKKLRGKISISSEKDEGTIFKLKIPLTLAIIDGMAIKVGSEHFIIPLTSVVEFIQPLSQHLKTVKGKGEVVKVRNEYIALMRLYELFDLKPKEKDPTEGILVIVQEAGKKICLFVEEILGQNQAVVKSLEDNYTYVEGLSGATILGDGSVAMILDVATIIRMALA
jgi:two-component system chemotaxis sensor kinase CheA